MIRERRPDVVLAVTTMLPAVPIAARLERVPSLVYCGELFDRGDRGGAMRALAGRGLAVLNSRLSEVIIACSDIVAAQFVDAPAEVVTVYPPIGERYSEGDQSSLRDRFGIPADAPVLASVGYVTQGRGQDMLVRAMPAILERLPEARYVLAGGPFPRPQDIAYRESLIELIDELGAGGLGDRRRPLRARRRPLRERRCGRQSGALQRALRPGAVRGGDRGQARRRDQGRGDPGAARATSARR